MKTYQVFLGTNKPSGGVVSTQEWLTFLKQVDSVFTGYNLRIPIIDTNTRQVNYQFVRYGFSDENNSIPEEKFKLVWKCKKRKSPFNNEIRTCPKLIRQ